MFWGVLEPVFLDSDEVAQRGHSQNDSVEIHNITEDALCLSKKIESKKSIPATWQPKFFSISLRGMRLQSMSLGS